MAKEDEKLNGGLEQREVDKLIPFLGTGYLRQTSEIVKKRRQEQEKALKRIEIEIPVTVIKPNEKEE